MTLSLVGRMDSSKVGRVMISKNKRSTMAQSIQSLDLTQINTLKDRMPYMSSLEVCSEKSGVAEVGFAKIGSGEISSKETCLTEVCFTLVRIVEDSSTQVGFP